MEDFCFIIYSNFFLYFWQKTEDLSISEGILEAIKHYCAYQERCHSEVRNKLISLKCYGEDLEELIGVLIQENYLNEERFATAYAGGKFRINGWGKLKISQHLKAKQVSAYCIKKGLEHIDDTAYKNKLLQLLIKKEEQSMEIKEEWKRKKKVVQYLLQRGFEIELIQDAWNLRDLP